MAQVFEQVRDHLPLAGQIVAQGAHHLLECLDAAVLNTVSRGAFEFRTIGTRGLRVIAHWLDGNTHRAFGRAVAGFGNIAR